MFFPFAYYGKIATEYDESLTLLQMVGNLARRTTALEGALQDATSVINLIANKVERLTLSVSYIDNADEIIIDIYNNKQYILIKNVNKITLLAKKYIHDCNCDNCICDIESKDGFICEINCRFNGKKDMSKLIVSQGFELAWCTDTDISDMTNATVAIWWDGSRFCAALGKYDGSTD